MTEPAPDDLCLAVTGRKLVVTTAGSGELRFPRFSELSGTSEVVPLATFHARPVWAAVMESTVEPPLMARGWASLAATLDAPSAALAARALSVMTFRRHHRYCGSCRAPLVDVDGEHARRCEACDIFLPTQISPAVVVLLRRPTGEILLVRHTYGPTDLWALVAGFVDPGESLEEAVAREVQEEVGLSIADLTYVASQPWGLSSPGVLLAGFTATVANPAAEPVVDGRELSAAVWFPPASLPTEIPPAYSLSRHLIDSAADR